MRLARREGKSFGSQGPQAKMKFAAEIFSPRRGFEFRWSVAAALTRGLADCGGCDFVGDAEFLGLVDYALDGAAGHQDAAGGFEDSPGGVVERRFAGNGGGDRRVG